MNQILHNVQNKRKKSKDNFKRIIFSAEIKVHKTKAIIVS